MPIVDHCFKNNNSSNKILRCIDQYQSSKNITHEKDHESYAKIRNLFDAYNFLLIPKIKEHKKKFIAATNEIISIAKNKNNEFIQRKLSISTPSSNQNNQNVVLTISGTRVNNTLKNLYVNQKKWLNTANLINWMVIQVLSSNETLNHISKMNHINDNDKKNVQCCFDHSKVQLDKARIIAVNCSNKCIDDEMLNLNNLIFSENKEQEAVFFTCFYNNARPEDIFVCMGLLQTSNYAPRTLKLSYNNAVDKFIKNQQFLSDKVLDCSYKSRDDFKQHLKHLNNQFDMCTQNQKSSEKCIIE
ncbi:uncharacterized protein LOC122857474 [Aphidius gifuensis]|uniref:uncharacterized protein LOC122857474 n=1 Tax=Aphidius gifuensis TaxID=684658 RepID=UPI001CDCEF60|nr:uncharacterized protein LOC122857474 [Aphidius gifuensis]